LDTEGLFGLALGKVSGVDACEAFEEILDGAVTGGDLLVGSCGFVTKGTADSDLLEYYHYVFKFELVEFVLNFF